MSVVGVPHDRVTKRLRTFTVLVAVAAALVAGLPFILALIGTPRGGSYIGFQYNTDDHMVYAAWMRQAMDGHFLFDNRFTTDAQPGLTINLYFWLLGLLARPLGIVYAAFAARLLFSGLFVMLLGRLVSRFESEVYAYKLAVSMAVIGGGIGFAVWHNFGAAIVRPTSNLLSSPLLGRLPTDVWQPEGYVFPSMLTNSLFMVSLCLIMTAFTAFIDARHSWKPVLPGALALAVLMNIHSYDVLMIALAMVGFLVASVVQKQVEGRWLARAAVMAVGVVPAALWFMHVLQSDRVFQARAATETYSPNFRQVLFGYLPMMLLALVGMGLRKSDPAVRQRRLIGLGLLVAEFATLYVLAEGHHDKYFMDAGGWGAAFLVALAAIGLLSDERPAWNLVASWAILGVVAMYFPALFQRKLAMGLSIPWCILAAFGVQKLLGKQERSSRDLATVLVIIVASATSLRWFAREIFLSRTNVSNTTVHPVYLSQDVVAIRRFLDGVPGRKVVAAPPGQGAAMVDTESGKQIPDEWGTPLVPDLNSILSGFTGAYSFAGHWSETPDYLRKRRLLQTLFFQPMPAAEQKRLLDETGASYIVAPVPEAFDGLSLPNLKNLGEVVLDGTQYRLIKVK